MLVRIKIIGRGGVGMDNIDVDYAKSKGITVINCFIIRISSRISFCPFIFWRAFHDSNRTMPLEGFKL
jgi:D-3-phosphoglycerate dehydrogenase